MAVNMKSVKQRIRSVQNMMQITKAMELVASSKLRKAMERAEHCRPYSRMLYRTLKDIAVHAQDISSVYVKNAVSSKGCYVVIAGDRGLAGGYHTNLFKCLEADTAQKEWLILPVGRKALEYSRHRNIECLSEQFARVEKIGMEDCREMSRMLCMAFQEGRFGHLELCCTRFFSMLSQQPESIPVLPLSDLKEEQGESGQNVSHLPIYEPDAAAVFEAIVPEYVSGLLYGGVCESLASELAARRTAMEAASSNAEEIIARLSLHYNRVRQAGITQEITEIIGGAETGS